MSDRPLDREALLRETHRLHCDIGYAGFRLEYFNDAATVKEWPDPARRERELRSFWLSLAEQAYPSYREQHADVSIKHLTALRDQLRSKLGGSGIDQVDHYNRMSEAGRRARFQNKGQGKDLGR